MGRNTTILRWLLLTGALYFFGISVVHMLRIKVPFLFVYFSVPSYGYQDRIISFLAFGWSAFLFSASKDPARNRDAVKAILIAGAAALVGLHVINAVTDFSALAPHVHTFVFNVESGVLTLYMLSLIIFYFLAKKEAGTK